MNIHDIQELTKAQREKRFSRSSQLSLGQFIEEIEKAGLVEENGDDKEICFDFGTAVPTCLDSWRGAYDELELGYKLTGYDSLEDSVQVKAKDILSELKSAIGKEFTGWKGGEYTMNENTPVWASNSGNASNSAVVGVLDDGWRLIILTAYCEY